MKIEWNVKASSSTATTEFELILLLLLMRAREKRIEATLTLFALLSSIIIGPASLSASAVPLSLSLCFALFSHVCLFSFCLFRWWLCYILYTIYRCGGIRFISVILSTSPYCRRFFHDSIDHFVTLNGGIWRVFFFVAPKIFH